MDNEPLTPTGWDEPWIKGAMWVAVAAVLVVLLLSWWSVADRANRDTEIRISKVTMQQEAIMKRLDEQTRFNDQVRKAIRRMGGKI